MAQMYNPGQAHIIGAPMDLGQEKRGVDLGPTAIRYAGLAGRLERQGWDVIDWGDVSVAASGQMMRNVSFGGYPAYHAGAIINIARSLHQHVEEHVRPQDKLIMLGWRSQRVIGQCGEFAAATWQDWLALD